jgi:hypothetical protein
VSCLPYIAGRSLGLPRSKTSQQTRTRRNRRRAKFAILPTLLCSDIPEKTPLNVKNWALLLNKPIITACCLEEYRFNICVSYASVAIVMSLNNFWKTFDYTHWRETAQLSRVWCRVYRKTFLTRRMGQKMSFTTWGYINHGNVNNCDVAVGFNTALPAHKRRDWRKALVMFCVNLHRKNH